MTGSSDVSDRAAALAQIAEIARRHGLTAADVASTLEPDALVASADPVPGVPGPAASRGRAILVRVLGFLGGTFVFAGIGVFVALQWDDMNSAARIIVTLGAGLAVFALGVIASRDRRFEKAATPLLLVAAAVEPTGMLVAFEELGSGGDWHLASLVTAGTMALQFAAVFTALRRSMTLFVAVSFGLAFWWTLLDYGDVSGKGIALLVGGAALAAAIAVGRTRHADVTPVWYLTGAFAFLAGLFDAVKHSPLELAFLFAAAGLVYLSVAVHSRTLLVAATLAILAYTGWFTGEHFADSIGWPLSLIAFGILMIGLSALAFRIDRDYVRQSGT